MLEALRNAAYRAVGAKQVLRQIAQDNVTTAYVAQDADPFLTKRVMDACYAKRIDCLEAPNMQELGRACQIDVKAAACATLRRAPK